MSNALTQTQIIQSLGEALCWCEKELEWGVPLAELNHLVGRIGELYAAMITRGQMAIEINQRGYDVISDDNERISVKTITSSNHVLFNMNTYSLVDRVMILRLNLDEETGLSVEILLDKTADEARLDMKEQSNNKLSYYIPSSDNQRLKQSLDHLSVVNQAKFKDYQICRYENQSIQVLKNGEVQSVAKPHLRVIAKEIGVGLYNANDKLLNTRQLGSHIIKKLTADSHSDYL